MTKCLKSNTNEIEKALRVHEENEPKCRGPDGWWAWLVCGASAMSVAIILGIIYSFGLLLPPLMETFDETRQTTGIAIANRKFGNRTQSAEDWDWVRPANSRTKSNKEACMSSISGPNRTQPNKSNRTHHIDWARLCSIRFVTELNRTATVDYVRLCSMNKFAWTENIWCWSKGYLKLGSLCI